MISGIHHVSLRCADDEAYARVREFYCGVLGLRVRREWEAGMMIETGAGCVEVFRSGGGERASAPCAILLLTATTRTLRQKATRARMGGSEGRTTSLGSTNTS